MSTTITIPELGEGVDSVDVVAVLVAVGDTVEVDQPLIEVETDKAAVEVPSTAAGTVTEILVTAGDSLGPDAPIVVVDEAEVASETDTDTDTETDTESASASAPDPVPVPESAAASTSADSDGDQQPSASVSATAPDTGAAASHRDAPDSRLTTHDSRPPVPVASTKLVPAAPTVRRFAREVGIDIATVEGSGPGGRISIDDVKAAVAGRLSRSANSRVGLPSTELPDFSLWGGVRREPMTKVRRLTAEGMTRAWLTAPQVTNHDLADITELEEVRRAYKSRVETAGGKLTITAILVKVAASALRLFPSLNASIDAESGEIVFKDYVNIGVAVDTEHGLLVPVVKNADQKNITEIAVELGDLAARARSRKLKPDEMLGGTFSISNLGGIGGTGFSPIVNWPEVAILGVSRSRVQPEWDTDLEDFEPRLMMPLSLSYDHRLVDGADAARFLRWLTEALESPLLLALEG
jgi:pyruvate dehydrogenase E2 component (dihydrolipoamide acetyltransferase)